MLFKVGDPRYKIARVGRVSCPLAVFDVIIQDAPPVRQELARGERDGETGRLDQARVVEELRPSYRFEYTLRRLGSEARQSGVVVGG